MKRKLLFIIGCSILLLFGCGNNASEENNTTEEVLNTEYIQESEIETQIETETETESETLADVEETLESTEVEESEPTETDTESTSSQSSSSSGNTWYDDEGFYYCITSSRDLYDYDGVKHTYYTGYAIAPNTGFKILIEDDYIEREVRPIIKQLANAGYDVPMYDAESGNYYIIMADGESDEAFERYADYMDAYAEQFGGYTESIGGGYCNIMDTNGNYAYLISAYMAH